MASMKGMISLAKAMESFPIIMILLLLPFIQKEVQLLLICLLSPLNYFE